MTTLKELKQKINSVLASSEVDDEMLQDSEYVSAMLDMMALQKMPAYVPDDLLEAFVTESEQSFKESTFKKFIPDYEEFLRDLEADFWASVMLGDVDIE